MENTLNNKIIGICFLLVGILVGITAHVLVDTAIALAPGSATKFLSSDFVRHLMPVGLGALVAVALYVNKSVMTWADDVVAEIRRVVWPSRKDTVAMTIVVCVMLAISGVILGVLDVVSAYVIDWLLHFNFRGMF